MKNSERVQKRVNEVVIELYRGSITDLDGEVDALVNAANTHLWMGGGVAGAIKRRGGREIEEEALAQGPVELGAAVVTTAGKLRCKYVIHAAGMEPRGRATAESVRESTLNSLRKAEELGLSSLALPAIGTGIGGFPLEEAARIQLEVALAFAREGPKHLKRIVFALYSPKAYETYRQALERLLS